jgi:hypothetical protein
MMKKILSPVLLLVLAAILLSSCKKWSTDKRDLYVYVPTPANPISDAAPLCGNVKGTMLTGKTYTVGCDIYIQATDSLIIQPGVRVNFTNGAGIIVKGSFFSLGTKDEPVWLTVAGQTKTDQPTVNYNAAKDSAFKGLWKGVLGDATAAFMIFKWTHLEYCGATLNAGGSTAYTVLNLVATDPSYAVYFSNPNGYLVMEDSWIYGTVDDAIRVSGAGGKFALLRNTFEKCGKTGGDVLNIKSGGTGDMAYNLFIGDATNGLKASDKGSGPGILKCNVRMYNNTVIDGGYRQTKTGRGGSINFEEGARGMAFNNLIVNCKFGLRILSNVAADTAYLYAGHYGYNYYWADSLSAAGEIYPTTYITKPQSTDFPNPSTFLPANFNYLNNTGYLTTAVNAVQKGNPLFFNYPLPVTGGYRLQDINAVGNFKFTLQPGSPCIGKGYKGFVPLQLVPVDNKYGVTDYSQPGSDIGCYQVNGGGNQHF